jgi:hypothetical protein
MIAAAREVKDNVGGSLSSAELSAFMQQGSE